MLSIGKDSLHRTNLRFVFLKTGFNRIYRKRRNNPFPAFKAELVILARAVTAMTSKAENFRRTDSTAFARPFIFTFLEALSISSKPFAAPDKFKLFFNLSKVERLV